ncbi:hypothetical protein [Cupriavidus sp. UYPR2.512]|uniref:hypothetical protein n=1 Tax=Cupriavidus sp. UYPR2.512 TaxID=1080187 RepID=UPI00036A2443|nr:hypothetical protein [Cupriavidus sp. UYPR2.512]UIF90854.1 hypothetical protein KAF44_32210 [Cupriavidus necator]
METDHLLLRGDLGRTPTFAESEANLKYLERVSLAEAAAASAATASAASTAAATARDAAGASQIASAQSKSDSAASATQAVAARQGAETARDTATAQAGIATTQAASATTSATTATSQAGTATTQAGNAATSAAAAAGSAAAAAAANSAIANGTATDAGTLTGAETIPASRGAGLLQTTVAKIRDYLTGFWLNMRLKAWVASSSFASLSSVTRDSNNVLLSANITWPDGTSGVFTTDAVNGVTPAIDAYHVTYFGTTTKTVTQPAVTRDANGSVTVQPAITIS